MNLVKQQHYVNISLQSLPLLEVMFTRSYHLIRKVPFYLYQENHQNNSKMNERDYSSNSFCMKFDSYEYDSSRKLDIMHGDPPTCLSDLSAGCYAGSESLVSPGPQLPSCCPLH